MYIIMYINYVYIHVHSFFQKKNQKKKPSLQSVLRCKKMGDHLNLHFPFFTSSWTLQLQKRGGGGGGGGRDCAYPG